MQSPALDLLSLESPVALSPAFGGPEPSGSDSGCGTLAPPDQGTHIPACVLCTWLPGIWTKLLTVVYTFTHMCARQIAGMSRQDRGPAQDNMASEKLEQEQLRGTFTLSLARQRS